MLAVVVVFRLPCFKKRALRRNASEALLRITEPVVDKLLAKLSGLSSCKVESVPIFEASCVTCQTRRLLRSFEMQLLRAPILTSYLSLRLVGGVPVHSLAILHFAASKPCKPTPSDLCGRGGYSKGPGWSPHACAQILTSDIPNLSPRMQDLTRSQQVR